MSRAAHPPEEVLLRFADGEGGEWIARHVAACASCRETVRRVRALDDLLAIPERVPGPLEERLLALPHASRRGRRACVAAAACILLGLGAAWALRPGEGRRAPATARAPEPPSRYERVLAALRDPTAAHEAFLSDEADANLVALHRIARGQDGDDARAAVERLGTLGRRASVPVLVDTLAYPDRREVALRALGAVGDPAAASAIARHLADPDLFPAARDALVAVGGAEAVEAMVRRLDEVEDAAALVAAVGKIRSPAATRALVDLLAEPARAPAARAALVDAAHQGALLDVAEGRDEARALAALGVLAETTPPGAAPALGRLLERPSHRAAAARALAAIDTPEAGALLFDRLGLPGVREAFAAAGPGIEAWLLERAATGDHRVRRRAVEVLGLCGSDRCVPTLASLADDPALAPEVVRTLGLVGTPAAIAALETLAASTALRRPVLDALAATGSADAVPALTRLGASDRGLRRPAIAALARIPHADAVRAILALDGSPSTRHTTGRALRAMDRDTVVPTLVALLEGGSADAAEARRWLATVRP